MELLGVQSCSKFSSIDDTFSEGVVILEELTESDSVSENEFSDFVHEGWEVLCTFEAGFLRNISRFAYLSGTTLTLIFIKVRISGLVEAVAVPKEPQIFNVTLFVAVDSGNSSNLIIINVTFQKRKNLLKLLWGDLEVVMSIVILEERLGVESLSNYKFTEVRAEGLHHTLIITVWVDLAVERTSSSIIKNHVDLLLKSLFGKHLVDGVGEIPPSYLIWHFALVVGAEKVELISTQSNFCH